MKEEVISNHLKHGYSNYIFLFLKKYNEEVFIGNKILDVGAGHYRNLKLFQKLGFNNLYAIDILKSNNPLKVPINFTEYNIENGLPYLDREFDIVLCNYVLMFINIDKQKYVLSELMRVSNNFLIIETNRLKESTKNTFFKDYDFSKFIEWITDINEFEFLGLKNGKVREKMVLRRVKNGKR
jgi:tellurite methyltransferase